MKTNLSNQTICFIGAGAMAEAIIRGIVDRKKLHPDRIVAVNRHNQNRLTELHRNYRIKAVLDSKAKDEAIRSADIIVLAMKPKDVEAALKDISPFLSERQLIVSVIAGLSIRSLSAMLQTSAPIVRTMPNTSSSIGLGATGVAFSSNVTDAQKLLVTQIFECVGIVEEVDESKLDIVTGLSGSGPAYVYYIIEAMTQAGIEGGLNDDVSRHLAVQTVLGAAQMVKQTKEDPAVLRHKVTSPGGTTQAALESMAQEGLADTIKRAVHRAAQRARELGIELEKEG